MSQAPQRDSSLCALHMAHEDRSRSPFPDDDGTSPFAQIDFAGTPGFVPRVHISPLTASCQDWVSVAEQLIGSPYRWGGRASTGLDCSALVQLSLALGGKAVPRDSGPQHAIGYALDETDELQRGDLVFWVGHVGIMQDGDRLLHANAHHMAVASEPLAVAKKSTSSMTTTRQKNSSTKKTKTTTKKKKRSKLEASNSFVTGFPGLLRGPRISGNINFLTLNYRLPV